MMENPSALLKAAQEYASQLITTKVSKDVTFHTLQHTREVVAACEQIAEKESLTEEDLLALHIAAWLHDTGYSAGKAKGHEQVSLQHMQEFFSLHPVEMAFAEKVKGCIMATRMPQNPQSRIEEIIWDADLYNTG